MSSAVSRTASSTKAARSRLSPYDRSASRKSPQAQSAVTPLSPSTPSSQAPSPISAQPGTLRESYQLICNRFYPNIQPRNDWDLAILASCRFKDGDFYEYSDSHIQRNYSRFTAEQVSNGTARAQLMREATELLETQETPTGLKPSPGDDEVHIRSIPNSDYSLRLWGKGLEPKHQYCLDFIHTTTGEPVNSPFKYELWAIPNKDTPWLPAIKSRLYSLERSFGVAQKDILPGEEKFVLLEGTTCLLVRPGMRSVRFKVPIRSHPVHDTADVDEISFS